MDSSRIAWLPLTRIVKEIKPHRRKYIEDKIRESFQRAAGLNNLEDAPLPKDEWGRDVNYYRELGVEPPDNLIEETNQVASSITGYKYDENDFEINERKIRIPEHMIDTIMESKESPEQNTLLMMSDGRAYFIKESIEQIDKMIELCQNI